MYYRTVAGNKTLATINQLVIAEEAGGAKFVENKVAAFNPTPARPGLSNIMKFNEIDGPVPPLPVLQASGVAAPAGKTLQWTGAMLVAGSVQIVDLYR